MRAVLVVVVWLVLAGPTWAGSGPYLDSASWPPVAKAYPLGPEGVPLVRYPSGLETNPVTVSEWGLQQWTWWLASHRHAQLHRALHASDWLVSHQRRDGAWAYTFPFITTVHMVPPWISAMAQGQAMSLLVRAYHHTGQRRYLHAAMRALGPLRHTIAEGGVVADFDGVPWFEEYANAESVHVLNGMGFTLVGLHDLAPRSRVARALFHLGARSVALRAGAFDLPALRSQRYAAVAPADVSVRGTVYLQAHVVLTRALARMTHSRALAFWASRWAGYL